MRSTRGIGRRVSEAAGPFLLAFVPGAYAAAYVKWISFKFPLNLVLPFHWTFIVLPSAALLLAETRDRRRVFDAALLAGSLVFALAFTQAKGLPLHFLIGHTYYPYPKPEGAALKMAVVVLAYVTAPLVLASAALYGKTSGAVLGSGGSSGAGPIAGFGAGAAAALLLVPALGANFLVAASAAALGFYHRGWIRKAIGVAGTGGIMALSFLFPDTSYLWLVREHVPLESEWTRSYKVDVISFASDRCMGGVLNHVMVMFVCEDPDRFIRDLRVLSSSPRLEKKRVLVLGRADGAVPQLVRKLNPGFERITAVEIDRAIPDLFRRHGKFSNGVLDDPRVETISGEFRNFLERRAERYDTVFYHGLGIHLLNLPMGLPFEENYVYTREALELLFDRVLERDGVLVMDWGSSKEYEAYYLVSNLPEGVKSRVVWSVTNEFPMTGLPLFLAVASRDAGRVDGTIEHLKDRVSPFREIELPRDLSPYRFTDDWPFINKGFAVAQAVVGVPFLVAAVLLLWRARGGEGVRVGGLASVVIVGTVYGILMSRNTRLFEIGPADAEPWILAAFWLGAAAAASRLGRRCGGTTAGGVLCSIAAAGVLALNDAVRAPAAGLLFAFLAPFFLHSRRGALIPSTCRLAGTYLTGIVIGVVLAQALPLSVGYRASQYVLAAATLLLGAVELVQKRRGRVEP